MLSTLTSKEGLNFSIWGTLSDDRSGIYVKVCDGKSMWTNESPIGVLSKLSCCRSMTEEEYVGHLKNALVNGTHSRSIKYDVDIYMTNNNYMMLSLTMDSDGSTALLLKAKLKHQDLCRTGYFDMMKEIVDSISSLTETITVQQNLNSELHSKIQENDDDFEAYFSMKDSLVDSMLTKMVYVLNHRRREAHIMKMRLKHAEEALQAKNDLATEQRFTRNAPSMTSTSDTAMAVAIAVADAEERAERAAIKIEEDVQRRIREAVQMAVEKTRKDCEREIANEGKPRRARYVPWQNKTNYIKKRREGGAEDESQLDGSSPPLAAVGSKRKFSNSAYRRQLRKLENGGAEYAESDSDASEAAAEAETFFALPTQEVESSQLLTQLNQSQELSQLNYSSPAATVGGGKHSGSGYSAATAVTLEEEDHASSSFLDGLFPSSQKADSTSLPFAAGQSYQSSLHDSLAQWPQSHSNSSSSSYLPDVTAHSSSSSSSGLQSSPPLAVATQNDSLEGLIAGTKTSSVFTKAKRAKDPSKYRSALSRFLHEDSADSDADSDF